MKNEDYLIESSDESIEQTYKNGIEYYNVAILLLKEYRYYNFFLNEDLPPQKLKDKYTKMNVILMNFSFAYENLMKYLLLKNNLKNNPEINKGQLWGRWIYGHGINKLYELATIEDNYKIFNFCNSFLKILKIAENLSHFKLLKNKSINYDFYDQEYFSKEHIEWELETWEHSDTTFTNENLRNFVIENDELFIKSRYSGENKTNYNFIDIYYFIEGVFTYVNIIHNNNGEIPNNIEREYIKYKINNPKIKSIISKRYTNEEINELMNLIKNNSILSRVLLGPDCYNIKFYSVTEIRDLINVDETFHEDYYLFLAILLGLTAEKIIEQKKLGNNIKDFINFCNNSYKKEPNLKL